MFLLYIENIKYTVGIFIWAVSEWEVSGQVEKAEVGKVE